MFVLKESAFFAEKNMNIKHYLRLLAASLLACTFLSCSKGGDTIGPVNTNAELVPSTANTMIVSIDGAATITLQAYGVKALISGDTMSIVAGSDNQKGVGLGLLGIHSAGTYPIGTEDIAGGRIQAVVMDYIYYLPGDTVKYLTPQPTPGSPSVGTLHLAELTGTTLKATFNATLTKTQGVAGAPTIKIAGGVNAILPK